MREVCVCVERMRVLVGACVCGEGWERGMGKREGGVWKERERDREREKYREREPDFPVLCVIVRGQCGDKANLTHSAMLLIGQKQ